MAAMKTVVARAGSGWSRRPVVFFALFVVVFLALQQGHLWWRGHTGNAWSARLNASVAARLINSFDPSAGARAVHTGVLSPRAHVEIMKGCEGSDVVLLAMAALIAFPLPLARKLAGLLVAAVLIYAINLVRIVSLFYVMAYRPGWFDAFHGIVWQTLIILLVAVFFFVWTTPTAHGHEPSR